MGEKKHIDRLFQEKFKDFDVSPPPQVWANIKEQLETPKRKKRIAIIPLWGKIGGIAASLLLLLTLGNIIYNTTTTATIVNTEKVKENPVTAPSITTTKNNIKNNSNSIANTPPSKKETLKGASSNNIIPNSKTQTAAAPLSTTQTPRYVTGVNDNTTVKTEKQFHKNGGNGKTNHTLPNTTYKGNTPNYPVSSTLAHQSSTKDEINENIEKKPQNRLVNTTPTTKNENNTAAETSNLDTKITPTIEEAIAETQNTTSPINEKEQKPNKWTLYANIAPVYYNSIGKGSHIDDQFINNKKEGEVNASYGVTVGYAITNTMTLRSGLNKLDLSYNTNNAVVYESVVTGGKASTIPSANINTHDKNTGKTVSVLSFNNLNVTQASNSFIENTIKPVDLNQKISYYEVPLEVEHRVVNKRFGVNLIYGLSTFILDKNEVISQLEGLKTVIGASNNINPVSFSTNVGVGLDYNFSKNLKVNVEPTFKYQLNAFENTSGNFNPYVVGVYTGFNYKF